MSKKFWGARYLSKNTVPKAHLNFNLPSPSWCTQYPFIRQLSINIRQRTMIIDTRYNNKTIYLPKKKKKKKVSFHLILGIPNIHLTGGFSHQNST
jgi:hypothetical protein